MKMFVLFRMLWKQKYATFVEMEYLIVMHRRIDVCGI